MLFAVRFRRVVVIAALAMVALTTAQPVFADKELRDRGTVGEHSLTDTYSHPGATCKYREADAGGYGRLKRIVVRPPNMRAVPGRDNQLVGWQFTVQREIIGGDDLRDWEKRYTSPTYSARTDDAHDAAFTAASVRVRVPFGLSGGGHAYYRVIVKMSWFRADGTVQGTAKHLVEFYDVVMDTGRRDTDIEYCPDYFLLNPA